MRVRQGTVLDALLKSIAIRYAQEGRLWLIETIEDVLCKVSVLCDSEVFGSKAMMDGCERDVMVDSIVDQIFKKFRYL